jgi:hypothetical protein
MKEGNLESVWKEMEHAPKERAARAVGISNLVCPVANKILILFSSPANIFRFA